MLNIKTLSFLVSTFRQITSTFGQDSKSVEFFKQQVTGLVNIGQVGYTEAQLIFKLLGMVNTNAVKWEQTNKKLDMFVTAMNYMIEVNSESRARLLEVLKSKGIVNDAVSQIISEVYGIKEVKLPEIKKPTFGVLNYTTEIEKDNKSCSNDTNLEANYNYEWEHLYNKLVTKSKLKYAIEVKNINAVCCSDASSYTISVEDYLKTNSKVHIYQLLTKGAPYKIGKRMTDTTDACNTRYYISEDKELKQELDNFDFSTFTEILLEKSK